jgi:hypothetical protein
MNPIHDKMTSFCLKKPQQHLKHFYHQPQQGHKVRKEKPEKNPKSWKCLCFTLCPSCVAKQHCGENGFLSRVLNPGESLSRCYLPVLFSFLCLGLPHQPLWADIEPSLEDILPVYFVADIQGQGNVQILREGERDWEKAKLGTRLEEGDRILVGDDTEVILSLKSETLVHLDENTEMMVARLGENPSGGFLSRLRLLTGSILSDVKKNLGESRSSFEVDAGGVVCGVRGTIFEVSADGDQIETSTDEGIVQVGTPRGSQQVKAGDSCSASPSRSPSLYASSGQTRARFQAWRDMRDRFRKKREARDKPEPKISRPLGNPSREDNRMGAHDSSGKSHGADGEKAVGHGIGHR